MAGTIYSWRTGTYTVHVDEFLKNFKYTIDLVQFF